MPRQIAELDAGQLRRAGLELTPSQVWNDSDGGLMAAIVNLSGCSAGFVSNKGLVATNHHCAQAALQAQSSVEHDYLSVGFLATSLPKEIQATGRTVKVLQKIEHVTATLREVLVAETDPAKRDAAVRKRSKELVAECEVDGMRCQVESFYNGSEFQLFKYLEFEDVRIVYAPPSAVGNYGGEVDNWMWPRHSGDFTLLRVYAGPDGKPAPFAKENVPYQPKRWLEVGTEGVAPGDFVAVLGFPGHTDRYLPQSEVKRQVEQSLPARIDLYGEWIQILEQHGAKDPAVKIKVAAKLRGLANRHKNARGKLEGIGKIGLLDRRQREDAALGRWAGRPENAKYRPVLDTLGELTQQRRESFGRDYFVAQVGAAGSAVSLAITLVRRAKERAKPDLERKAAFMDRGQARLWRGVQRALRDYDAGVDDALLSALLRRVVAQPEAARFTAKRPEQIKRMLASSKVTDPVAAKAMFDAADWPAVEASRDPMLVWARELVVAIEALEQAREVRRGIMLEQGPLYFDMLKAVRKGPVYPDANGTMRFSYATVMGYSPRDGLQATPQSTLAGQVAKHQGVAPFDLPQKIREIARTAAKTYWADPLLGDVPVCFLSNADTTGGNSGSPVVDGKGRWVGLNFDRVWENIAGDYGYATDRSRNITVDVRYVLWMLDEVAGAKRLLEEMGISDKSGAAPQVASKAVAAKAGLSADAGSEPAPVVSADSGVGAALPKKQPPAKADAGPGGCGCRSGTEGRWGCVWMLGLVLGAGVRRRRTVAPTRRRGADTSA